MTVYHITIPIFFRNKINVSIYLVTGTGGPGVSDTTLYMLYFPYGSYVTPTPLTHSLTSTKVIVTNDEG